MESDVPAGQRQPERPRGRPRAFNDKTDQNTIQALDRALGLLTRLAASPGLTLSELAGQSGQAAATVYRALITMQGHGMVELEEQGQVHVFVEPQQGRHLLQRRARCP